jgi:hypothetical protein
MKSSTRPKYNKRPENTIHFFHKRAIEALDAYLKFFNREWLTDTEIQDGIKLGHELKDYFLDIKKVCSIIRTNIQEEISSLRKLGSYKKKRKII